MSDDHTDISQSLFPREILLYSIRYSSMNLLVRWNIQNFNTEGFWVIIFFKTPLKRSNALNTPLHFTKLKENHWSRNMSSKHTYFRILFVWLIKKTLEWRTVDFKNFLWELTNFLWYLDNYFQEKITHPNYCILKVLYFSKQIVYSSNLW